MYFLLRKDTIYLSSLNFYKIFFIIFEGQCKQMSGLDPFLDCHKPLNVILLSFVIFLRNSSFLWSLLRKKFPSKIWA